MIAPARSVMAPRSEAKVNSGNAGLPTNKLTATNHTVRARTEQDFMVSPPVHPRLAKPKKNFLTGTSLFLTRVGTLYTKTPNVDVSFLS
jgi:hypothetical protein